MHVNEMSDEELARRATAKIDNSLDELLSRYERRIAACAREMAIRPDAVEDLIQEISLRIVASLPSFEGKSAFSTWVYRLSHNTCIDAFRRESRASVHQIDLPFFADGDTYDFDALPTDRDDPQHGLEDRIVDCYLARALKTLPDEYRTLLRLRVAEGMSNAAIAEQLDTTVDAIKAKMHRARNRLRHELVDGPLCPFCKSRFPAETVGR